MAVPLGINVKNEVVYLNLHEKYHGPHGLVAGTTGSGKSEILQSFILSAATFFHPYEIGFVIIDFKGGGMVNQFKNLPHLLGAITNIDGKEIDRSLKSIKAELLKRQTLFAEMDVNHIDKYIQAYKEGRATVALPHLVIIVDEFAELKAEQPEFMKELISAARIGRSLGVHLILATQKPAGQVNEQIWSNSKFKLCLKVQSKEDSNEVIKSPLAAEIREPGRAYLQVGNNEIFELFQSAYSGAPEKERNEEEKEFQISAVDFLGRKRPIYNKKNTKATEKRTQLEAMVEYISEYCNNNSIDSLQSICLPPLRTNIPYVESGSVEKNLDMSIPIGVYDDPEHQYQGNVKISVGTTNTIIVGSPQYGKTNLLEEMVRKLTDIYSPSELNLYILDFGSMVLKNFEHLAHVGGVVCSSEDEKFKNLIKFLNDQVEYRRKVLLEKGVSSFVAYKEAGYTELPQIVVFIDNMTMLKELYLQNDDPILQLCREGQAVGISFVVANAMTSGFGFKYLANFSTRIALYCNENGEYLNLFGSSKVKPEEYPGRGIIEIDKSVYEFQTFLAFEGQREIDRVNNMKQFVSEINDRTVEKAIRIPEIPEMLNDKYIFENYSVERRNVIMGLDYETVLPVIIKSDKNNMLAISGNDEERTNYIRYIINFLHNEAEKVELYIFDDFQKKLCDLYERFDGIKYLLGDESYKEIVEEIHNELAQRYQNLINVDGMEQSWIILVVNNEDIISKITSDKETLEKFKDIIGKYKMLNVFVIMGNVPNEKMSGFGISEIYKNVRDSKNMVFFDDLINCNVLDVPISAGRKFKKKINERDAFYFYGNDVYKIKVPTVTK
jgi:S-DNA-T family DNA segregation ATPase FtsK/SpoIIIE